SVVLAPAVRLGTVCVPFRFFVPPPTVFTRTNFIVDERASLRPWFFTSAVMVSVPRRATELGAPATATDVTMRSGRAFTSITPVEVRQLLLSFVSGAALPLSAHACT